MGVILTWTGSGAADQLISSALSAAVAFSEIVAVALCCMIAIPLGLMIVKRAIIAGCREAQGGKISSILEYIMLE